MQSLNNLSSSIYSSTERIKPLIKINNKTQSNTSLKTGIWIYFFLLIFEGALRKWLLPGLATPLLIIRDPIAVWLIFYSLRKGIIISNIYLTGILCISIIGFFSALFLGHKNLVVALFGVRIFILHFPLVFIIGKIFTAADVIKLGKAMLFISIPITILVVLQFYSPQSAWVNRGIGGDMEGAGFSGAKGYFRPSATFSFTTGAVQFYSFLACFILYFVFKSALVNRLLLIAAIISLLIAVPLSISRTLLFQVLLTFGFSFIAISKNPKYLGKILLGSAFIMMILLVLNNVSFFVTASEAFTDRFETANESEGGIKGVFLDRFLGGMIESLSGNDAIPFFGYGIGMGTNAGSKLLTGGTTFLISEGEWGRVIGELGPLSGLIVIMLRFVFCLKITIVSYKRVLQNDFFPWILLSFGFIIILQGQWAQPGTLGFSTLVAGLILALLNDAPNNTKPEILKGRFN